jgi:hypothetical protein
VFLLAAAVAIATVTEPLEMRVEVTRGQYLQVLLVSRGPTPVLITPRTSLGAYIEVEIQDSDGRRVGHFGPRSSDPTPDQSEYRMLRSDADFGAQLFGVEIDILATGRVRLVNLGGEVGELNHGQEYWLVVTYHNDDNRLLKSTTKQSLQRKYGQFTAPVVNLRSERIAFRRPS